MSVARNIKENANDTTRLHSKSWDSTIYLLAEISVSAILSFISLRVLILSLGFYDYSDVHWGIIATPHLLGTFSPFQTSAGFVLYGFMRDVISWPYYLMYLINVPMAIIERALLLYSFILYFMIAFRLSDYIVQSLSQRNGFLLSKRAQFGISLIIAIFAFSNLEAMNYNVDSGTFSDGLILLFMACSMAVIIFQENKKEEFAALAFFLIISTLLDPDYYIYFIIVILVGLAVNGAMNHRFTRSILTVASVSLISLTVIIFIYIVGIYTTSVASPVSTLGVYRVLPTTPAPFADGVPYFLYYLMLFGHGWSTMTFGPITILQYYGHILDAPSMFSPAQILIPPGPVTWLWFIALFLIPVFAFGSLFFKNTRRLLVPVVFTAILVLILSQYTYISPLLFLFDRIASIPYIGAPFSTTFGRPAHALIVISASYIVMICILLINLQSKLSKSGFGRERQEGPWELAIKRLKLKITISKKAGNKIAKFLVVLLVFAVLFSGWQAFNGEFYPSRAFPPNNGGNQVVEIAPYQPYEVPQSAFMVLHYLQAEETATVQVLQIGAPYISNRTFLGFEGNINPHLSLNGNYLVGNYLNQLISENLTSDIAPFLQANSIGYVVVEFYSITPSYVEQEFGFSNFGIVLQRLDSSPGLSQVLSYPNITLYKVAGVKNLYYNSQLSLSISNAENFSPEIYSAFRLVGLNISVTQYQKYGVNFNLNPDLGNLGNSSISLFTASQIYSMTNESNKRNGTFILSEASGLPFSHILNINSTSLELPKNKVDIYYYIYAKGNGSINNASVNTHGQWSMVTVESNSSLLLNGNFSISYVVSSKGQPLSGYASNNIVYNVGAARGYELTDGNVTISGGIPTFQGTNLFPDVPDNGFHVKAPFAAYVVIYYFAIVVTLVMLGLYAAGSLIRKKWIKLVKSH